MLRTLRLFASVRLCASHVQHVLSRSMRVHQGLPTGIAKTTSDKSFKHLQKKMASSPPWYSKLGPTLLTKEGDKIVEKPTADVVNGAEYIGLYFSAHWCGPCRKFTPLLSVVYEDQTTPEGGKKRVEVVFVSSDSDDSEFDEYYGEMPWSAVKYDFEGREDLSETYEVSGIPKFVVLKASDGSVAVADGRGAVTAKKSFNIFG